MKEISNTPKRYVELDSPIGGIRIEGSAEMVTRLRLPGENSAEFEGIPLLGANENFPALRDAEDWLTRYFAGEQVSWVGRPIPPVSKFTAKVYRALLEVPAGATVSYGQLAAMAGSPNASRAVGRAMATNRLAILIPCHRVLGSDGSLHGYGGGLPMKKALLVHEGVVVK